MAVVILPVAIYEVSGGQEVYKWDQDWFVPYMNIDDFKPSGEGQYFDTDSLMRANTGIPKCSFFYCTTSTDAGLVHITRAINISVYEGKTIRAYVKPKTDNRYIEINFDVTSSTAYMKTVRCTFNFKYQGNSCFYDYFTASVDRNGDVMIDGHYVSIPFPSIDGTAAISPAVNERWDYVNELRRYSGNESWNYSNTFKNWIIGFEPEEVDEDNPYWEGGTSDEDGGGGNFSDDSDTVDEDDMPDIDAVGTGFATLFTPSKTQLTALADVMWDNNVFAALQNLVENIQNMFTSLAIVPFTVTAGSTVEVTWLGLPITNIFLTLAAKQFFEFDMGSIDLANDSRIYTSGSALDYSPFSKLGIFLPFIGYQDLDIDECRDSTIGLKYRIDILSGSCVALVSINGNTIYQFSGNCLAQIPITNENMQSLVSDAVQVGIAMTAASSAGSAVSAAEGEWGAAQSAGDVAKANTQLAHAQARSAAANGQLASATANAAMGMKPTYGKAGSISAASSLLAVKQPYLFLTTPRQSIPDHYQRYCGFPSNISGKLSSFSGYTVVEDIRLNGLVATSPEVAEIYQLLKSGVII